MAWQLLAGAALGGLFGSRNKSPKPVLRDPNAEYEAAMRAQLKYAPDIFSADKQFTPQYTDLELSNQERSLFGTEGGQAGILEILNRAQPQIDEMTRQSTSYQRAGDVADVSELGPQATEAFRKSAGTDVLTSKLKEQAEEGLEGDILNPRLRREFDQVINRGQAALGRGYGPADLGERAVFTAMQAKQMERDNQRFAQSVIGTLQGTSVDPFMAILGRPGQAMAAGDAAFGKAAGIANNAGPSGMFGMNNYFAGVGDYNANARNASNIAGYNARNALMGGMIQGGASLAGAYGMGRMGQGKSFFPIG